MLFNSDHHILVGQCNVRGQIEDKAIVNREEPRVEMSSFW